MQILPVLEEAFELVREYLLTEGYEDPQTVRKILQEMSQSFLILKQRRF